MWYAGIAISRLNWKYDRGAKAPLPFSLTESNKYCKIEAAKGINKIFDKFRIEKVLLIFLNINNQI